MGWPKSSSFSITSHFGQLDTMTIYIPISTIILYFKITHEELISGNRREEVVIARQMALYLCRTETTESLKEICEYFNIDSNSFIFACDKISENLKGNKKIQNDYDNIMKILKEE